MAAIKSVQVQVEPRIREVVVVGLPRIRGVQVNSGLPGPTGPQGVSIVGAEVDEDGHLILMLSDGSTVDSGYVIGPQGIQGISVTNAVVNGSGHLIITLSNGGTVDAGVVIGPKGDQGDQGPQGVSITGATVNGSGHLILTLSTGGTVDVGYIVGPKGDEGPQGVSITGATVNGSGDLILTLSTGGTVNAGHVVGAQGPQGVSITNVEVDGANHLIVTLSNGTEIDVGAIAATTSWTTLTDKPTTVAGFGITDAATVTYVDGKVLDSPDWNTPSTTQAPSVSAVTFYIDDVITALNLGTAATRNVGTSSGNVPVLDGSGKLDTSILPALAITSRFVVNSQAAMLALAAQEGDIAIRTDVSKTFILGTNDPTVLANWSELLSPTDGVTSVAGLTGPIIGAAALLAALDGNLNSIAGHTYTAGQMIYWTADETTAVISTTAYGRSLLNAANAAGLRTLAELSTTDIPQFAGLNIGHATDTTVTRARAGFLAVEGVEVLNASGAQTVNDKDLVDSTTDIVGATDTTKRSGFSNDLVTAGQRRVMTIPDRAGVIMTDVISVTEVPTALDYRLDKIDGAPFPDFFSRSGGGGYSRNSKGIMVPALDNEPAIHFTDGGVPNGTRFFAAYTNFILWSEQFDNATWQKWGTSPGTVTANNVAAPDGTMTADRFVGAGTDSGLAQSVSGFVIGDIVNVSVWMRADTPQIVNLYANEGGGGNSFVACNLTTEWQRFSVTRTLATTIVNLQIGGAGTLSAGETIYVWGGQISKTNFMPPYVQTTSAAVVRNADNFAVDGTEFTDFYNQTEGTLFVDFQAPSQSVPLVVAGFSNGSDFASSIYISVTALNTVQIGAGTNWNIAAGSGPANTEQLTKVAFSFSATGGLRSAVNGTEYMSDGSIAVVPVNRLTIGKAPWGDGNYINGQVRRLTYWPEAFSSAQLQRMTAL